MNTKILYEYLNKIDSECAHRYTFGERNDLLTGTHIPNLIQMVRWLILDAKYSTMKDIEELLEGQEL